MRTTAQEPKRAHFRVPAFKNDNQNSTRRPPKGEEKSEFSGGRKKSAKFWAAGGGWSWGKGGHGERAVLGKAGLGEGRPWVSRVGLGWVSGGSGTPPPFFNPSPHFKPL